jgi:hypothetical protein
MRDEISSRIMPRTTVDIDESVLREAKKRAKATGKTLGEVVSELMAAGLGAPKEPSPPVRFHWHAKAMQALVDLDDKDAVHGAAERA